MHTTYFAYNGSHRIGYAIMALDCPWTPPNAGPRIVDAPLTVILEGGIDIVCISFAETGRQYNHYVTISMNSSGIIHVTSLQIFDALLMLVLMIQ
jgi:hypothetical protein